MLTFHTTPPNDSSGSLANCTSGAQAQGQICLKSDKMLMVYISNPWELRVLQRRPSKYHHAAMLTFLYLYALATKMKKKMLRTERMTRTK